MAAKKLWAGRFRGSTDPSVERFTASVQFDRALARYDIRASIAHARMLASVGLVSPQEADALVGGLEAVGRDIESGDLSLDPALEDIHMNVETHLRERVGELAGRLHTGRSRNDQVATDLALYLRDAARAAGRGLIELREVLIARGREHLDTVVPGYTHLQRAQPVRLAHHWLAYVEMFGRDAQRFAGVSTATRRRERSASASRRATAWTPWLPATGRSSSWPREPSAWCTSRAWQRSSSSGRRASSASSSSPMPTRPGRA
jgi:argininosuccinate lyase